MNRNLTRRLFLKRAGICTAGILGASAVGFLAKDKGRYEPLKVDRAFQIRNFQVSSVGQTAVLAVAHGDAVVATRAAIKALGGMERFIRSGESVVVKPNVGWDRIPIQAANTNPAVVQTIVKLCFEAGASRVVVTDNPCNDAKRCFTRSGIWKAAEEAGGQVVLPAPHRFRTYDLGGVILGKMPVLTAAMNADKFINVAVAKHHGLSGFTGAMKNLYGVLGGRRNRLHQKIDDSIDDLVDFLRATLTVMDATRVLLRNGPQGGDVADTLEMNQVIASLDPVAVDAYSCGLINVSPADLPYLAKAGARGLGIADLNRVQRIEV